MDHASIQDMYTPNGQGIHVLSAGVSDYEAALFSLEGEKKGEKETVGCDLSRDTPQYT